jgi:hypothetical protein
VLRLVCSAENGALVQAALTQVQADLDRQRAAAAAEPAEAAGPTEAAGVSAETPAPAVPQPPPASGALDVSAETSGPPQTPEPVPATLNATDLKLADLGRTRREPSQRLRELLGTIDGERCRFPGCTRHHTLLHTQGFQLTLHPDRTIRSATLSPDQVEPRLDLRYLVSVMSQQAA